ncbi:MAG: shikimate dehydrogenase [Gammaproteobacteria bacterium]|nr:shikimate dehydrogenase [Gammaproteobacteria bacterium]
MASIFDFESKPDEYAVMGNPIAHSKSPQIHAAFAQQTRQCIQYSTIQVDPGGFAQAVGNFFATGGKGLNVTVPFKREAYNIADELSERATLAGAVNTLKPMNSTHLYGDNTDGIGLVRDLTNNLGIALRAKRILLIGAGGAARGVLAPLIEQQPATLTLSNRSLGKAEQLAKIFAPNARKIDINAMPFSGLNNKSFDLVINATSASLNGELPPIPATVFSETAWSYDMMYGADATAFMRWSRSAGVSINNIVDGLGMLVEQAAESFQIWRAIAPDTKTVIQLIRQNL